MNPNISETCPNCGCEYEFPRDSDKARILIFLERSDCNLIRTQCPRCGETRCIFCSAEIIMINLQRDVRFSIGTEPEDFIVAQREACVAPVDPAAGLFEDLKDMTPQDFV